MVINDVYVCRTVLVRCATRKETYPVTEKDGSGNASPPDDGCSQISAEPVTIDTNALGVATKSPGATTAIYVVVGNRVKRGLAG
jgi:uncharacterized RmlC-like cupin family protein